MTETLSAEPSHLKNKFTVLDSDIENQSDFYSIENHLFANEVKIVNEPLGLYSKGNGNSEPAADHMKNSFKLPRRTGILKAMVDAKIRGNFAPVQGILDTAAARSVVEENSPLLLSGRAKSKAIQKLFFIEDEKLLKAVADNKPAIVKTLHGQKGLSPENLGVISVRVNSVEMNLIAIKAPKDTLGDSKLILDVDALRLARVDVNGLLRRSGPEKLAHLSLIQTKELASSEPRKDADQIQTLPELWCGFVEEAEYRVSDEDLKFETDIPTRAERSDYTVELMLTELKCKTALLSGNPFTDKKYTLDMVEVADESQHMTKERQRKLRALVREFKDIFVSDNALPPPMKRVRPVKILFKDGAQPVSCPRPRWGPYQDKLLRSWTQKALKEGLVEMADDDCVYASRPHLTAKPNGGIRVTGDYSKLNETIPKRPMNLPNMEDQLRRHLGAKYFTVADAAQGYFQMILDKESRQKCAIWTPLGKVVPTRLPMGIKNAGVVYQDGVNGSLESLPETTRDRTSNYLDDYMTSGETFEEYLTNTRNLFKMYREHGITLNPAKTRLGYPTAKMLGREVSENQIVVHDDNLQSLKDCTTELKDVHEVKRVLGICEFARKHVPNFAELARPLHNLTRKKVPWRWTHTESQALEKLKTAVLTNIQLHVPDHSKPLYLFTDASDLGMGAQLCQLKNPVKDEDLKKVKESDKLPIAFYSASFNESMQRRPVYYREARAMIWGLAKTREFTERSPHEVVVVTDHAPLQWIKHSIKGTVTSWLLQEVADIEYRVVYMSGKANTTADALSRQPLVSPARFTLVGAEDIWDALLRLLSDNDMNSPNVHVWAAQHTPDIQRRVQAWRNPTNPINVRAPKSMLKHVKTFDLILSAPTAEEAPIVAHHILKGLKESNSDATFACLVPTDLLPYIPSGGDENQTDRETKTWIKEKLEEGCIKHTHTKVGFTWLIFNAKSPLSDKVYTTENHRNAHENLFPVLLDEEEKDNSQKAAVNEKSDLTTYGNVKLTELDTWTKEQANELETIKKHYAGKWAKRDDGLILITSETGNKVYVPTPQRKKLVMQVHREMVHGLIRRVRRVITTKFDWPRMISDILTWVGECSECPLRKAKMNISHNLYSPTDWKKPRNAYGVDFYGIAKSSRGHVGVLTVTDLFTRFVMFIPVKDTTAETFAQSMMESVVFQRGAFKYLISDGAQAFVGNVAANLAAMLKIKKVETYNYPQGNSTTERNHLLLGEFLRLLPEEKRPDWDREIGAAAYAHNMCVNSSTGFSPFELDCGYQPSSTADLMFQGKPLPVFETETFARTPDEQKQLVQRVKDMHKIAREMDRLSKEISIQRLNNPKISTQEFQPGDKVMFYVHAPSSQSGQGKWKAKHLTHWRRGTITSKLSSSTYEVVDDKSQTFLRSIALIRKDSSSMGLSSESPEIVSEEKFYQAGTTLAIREDNNPENKELVVVETLKTLESGSILVKYFGTTSKDVSKAKFNLVWVDENDRVLLRNQKPQGHKAMTAIIDPDLILGEIKLNARNTLIQETVKDLLQKGFKFQVLKTTNSKKPTEIETADSHELKTPVQAALDRWKKRKANGDPEPRPTKRAQTSN